MADPKDRRQKRTLADAVDDLQAQGRYTLGRREALSSLGVAERVLDQAVVRLSAKIRIVVPRRGFYVIVPLEYRAVGLPPPSWFIDDLMRHLGKRYYVGVLSAAALYGAGRHQPQEFQVVTESPQRPIIVGRLRMRFFVRRNLDRATTASFKTDTGSMLVSTPEATALDLIRFAHGAGGLSNVATVLAQLAERIDPVKLVETVRIDGELARAQRLGLLLELVGAGEKAMLLEQVIRDNNARVTPLRPGRPTKGRRTSKRWRVVVNDEIEAEL